MWDITGPEHNIGSCIDFVWPTKFCFQLQVRFFTFNIFLIYRFEAETEVTTYTAYWRRKFNGKLFESRMYMWNNRLIEKFGIFSYAITIRVDPAKNTIFYSSTDSWVFGLKIPKVLPLQTQSNSRSFFGWNQNGKKKEQNKDGNLKEKWRRFGAKSSDTRESLELRTFPVETQTFVGNRSLCFFKYIWFNILDQSIPSKVRTGYRGGNITKRRAN